jgi:hypothetical protein
VLEMQPSLRLLELQAELDRAVLRAYAASTSTPDEAAAWNDLTGRAEPNFLDEANEDDHTCRAIRSGPLPSATSSRAPPRPQRQGPREACANGGRERMEFLAKI